MGPELLLPEKFDLKHSRPTKLSDCYAFGMVIYEVLSGEVPFRHYGRYVVVAKVLEGERPERPRGAGVSNCITLPFSSAFSSIIAISVPTLRASI